MSRYLVSIMGDGILSEKWTEAFITLEEELHKKKAGEVVDMRHILFNPMEFLGDIQYISQNMSCYEEEFGIKIFCAPYKNEPILKAIEIEDEKKYFNLLDCLKNIIYCDRCCTLLDVYRLSSSLNMQVPFSIWFQTGDDKNDYPIYQPMEDIFEQYSEDEIKAKSYIYRFPCDDIADIVMAVFTYCVISDYHFYQCQHCKKYSAEVRHQKDRRYCERSNILNLANYEGDCCRKAIPKMLNTLAQNYVRKRKYLENRMAHSNAETALRREKEYEAFKEEYRRIREKCRADPSAENLIKLKNFLDSIHSDCRKKRNS